MRGLCNKKRFCVEIVKLESLNNVIHSELTASFNIWEMLAELQVLFS
ncbi:MAG: hypothetical protein K0Q94_1949 [Paenibacillus sp.]|jgi:hypothetical protein|nr:hypothetical protein [Paenibacillus sp.]